MVCVGLILYAQSLLCRNERSEPERTAFDPELTSKQIVPSCLRLYCMYYLRLARGSGAWPKRKGKACDAHAALLIKLWMACRIWAMPMENETRARKSDIFV